MELTMQVEPAGWGWLRFADAQVVMTIRASYVTDVLTNIIEAIAEVADGADSAATHLGLEPGEAILQIERYDGVRSMLTLGVGEHWGPRGKVAFPVETRLLARLGLSLAASVDRETYLDSWYPDGSWPADALERLQRLEQQA